MAPLLSDLSLELTTHSPEETQEVGRRLGAALAGGEVLLLVGALGTGKTTLAQGIAQGLGIREYTKSPTFVLVNEYQGRLPLYHVDLYRIEGDLEAWELGLDEYLEGPGVCVVEWADRALRVFPSDHLLVTLKRRSDTERLLRLKAQGPRAWALLAAAGLVSP